MTKMTEPIQPKLAILDGDIIAYKAACWADTEGIDSLEDRLSSDVSNWTPEGVDQIMIAFSCSRDENYRRQWWSSYKAHRSARPDPDSLAYAKEILFNEYYSKKVPHLEADDIMGLGASSDKAIAVTIDKDLKGVPGWHWNPDKQDKPEYISEYDADKFFACQIVAGDPTDGIPGLPGKGPKYFEKEILQFDHEDWFQEILWAYEELGHNEDYFLSQARCVRILRNGEYDKETGKVIPWSLPILD